MIELKYFIIYITVINLISFILMGYDKFLAKNNRWRISENTFIFISIIFGSIGTYIGIYKFKHKTKHIKFTVGIPLIFIINLISIYYIYTLNILIF